jgi:hypothetical protein
MEHTTEQVETTLPTAVALPSQSAELAEVYEAMTALVEVMNEQLIRQQHHALATNREETSRLAAEILAEVRAISCQHELTPIAEDIRSLLLSLQSLNHTELQSGLSSLQSQLQSNGQSLKTGFLHMECIQLDAEQRSLGHLQHSIQLLQNLEVGHQEGWTEYQRESRNATRMEINRLLMALVSAVLTASIGVFCAWRYLNV